VKNIFNAVRSAVEDFLNNLGLGMRSKLIIIFVVIKVIPLVILTIMAWNQARILGTDLIQHIQELQERANNALTEMGDTAVANSIAAIDNLVIEALERTSTDMANRVAAFLYQRDNDILYAAGIEPDEAAYRHFLTHATSPIIKKREWVLSPDGKSWIPKESLPLGNYSASTNSENNINYRNRPRELWETEDRPLYLEMTYIDLNGNEIVKVTASDQMDKTKKNVSDRANTYVKAETYFSELKNLKAGEIYVSEVIGAYVGSRLIGMYTPENCETGGLEFRPEEEAYAGRENPNGKRFKGIIRWAAPVTRNGRITGYVTLALDHDHIMEFTDHTTPMTERYVEVPSAYEGNYAFIWDYKCRSICHPRHHSIVGFNPETGDPEVPWLEESIYRAWQESGLSYTEFIKDVPVFQDQSRNKRPAPELTAAGLVGLDGRYLNNAPQCTGWFDLTKEGGSGSFLILWSGIWKPNTAATIPYYTGRYGQSKRGFGFVAIGAGLEDFQQPALATEAALDRVNINADTYLTRISDNAQTAIRSNLFETAAKLVLSAGIMILLVVLIAIWMASVFTTSITNLIAGISRFRAGQRHFRFNAPVKDEIGMLADSFDEMADSLTDADRGPLVITDMNLKILYANDESLKLRDKKREDLLNTPYYDFSLCPAGSKYDPVYALSHGGETEVLYIPEARRYVKGDATYLTNKEGENIGYIITFTDLTEIIDQQKKTAEQKALLDTVFTSSPDLIWYENAEEKLLTANPRFASVFNRRPENIIGCDMESLMPAELSADYRESRRRAVESKKTCYYEQALTFADGHRENLDTVLTPIFDSRGLLRGVLGFARNVTARVKIEEELRHTQEDLEKAVREANLANEHKGNFLARMSHEIRTPMNAIIGMTGIVKKRIAEPDVDREGILASISQIETSSAHLLGLLNDILDISKIEAGKIELSRETMDIPRLLNTVVTIIKPRCSEKNINFYVNTEMSEPAVFWGDPLRLRQVLINLLGNAVKFTSELGTVEFTVTVLERRDGKALLEFLVRDTGIGITEEAQKNLFKPFEQATNQISQKYGGTGLGLAISRSIVQLFGNDISVKSRIGEGSEFKFAIWLDGAEEEKKEDIVIANAEGAFRGKRALLVDDVEINRFITVSMLEATEIEVDEAADGEEALAKFRASPENTYDIIYMDIQMPKMNGYDSAMAIRALDREDAKNVPIVALTANAFKDDIDKAHDSGMNAHLAKPLELDRLLEVTFRLTGAGK
jgi:PAS domain S-box-containing protein